MQNYRQMWQELGLNLEAHDNLMQTLGTFYQSIYLSQKNRPDAMKYFDFVISEVHGLRIKELQDARAIGRKVIGTFCVFVPEELILAADAVCIGLCAGAEAGFELAEQHLPKNTCGLIKSFFGFKLAGLCPYANSCDLVVGETTCDGKKKAYELFNEIQPVHVMEVPQTKSEAARALFHSEIKRFKERLEALTGIEITAQRLKKAIKIVNNRRRALNRLNALRSAEIPPISGLDALLINQIAFYDDPIRFTDAVNKLCDELEERVKNGQGITDKRPIRILMSGCPMAIPNWNIPFIVETTGAVIVGEESCVGIRNTRNTVPEDLEILDEMLSAITERYFKIDCATFTPNQERMDHIVQMAKDLHADGVIHYAIQFCQPYTIESKRVENTLKSQSIPLLRLETDYSMQDIEALKTRIEAFKEVITP